MTGSTAIRVIDTVRVSDVVARAASGIRSAIRRGAWRAQLDPAGGAVAFMTRLEDGGDVVGVPDIAGHDEARRQGLDILQVRLGSS